ncbi:hypothetical protein EST38_g7942 [Candolleomyces aberdarensis]|uniref:Pheromone receptor n=1 Tax=Candolleomyces aberdarensis TaxID=2316362 RepID=A0A4Q2DFN9_9AGAR|nr:hypothetical protein EST38_g7942 [Candolleomyces aberdarensis]
MPSTWHPELPFFAFLSAVLVLIPLPWHWQARNVATLSMIFWLFVVSLIYGINTIVWRGHARDVAPVYCDIATKIVLGGSYGLPFATLCIAKHLEMVSSSRTVSYTIADRKRRMILDAILCFFCPMIFMALHYVVQGHRYDIIQNLGCTASIYISIPAIFIIWFPPLLSLALHHFVQRRLIFAAHLQNSKSGLTTNRYLRLIAMAITTMFWGTSIHTYIFYVNVAPGLRPYTSWADVHFGFSRVDKFLLLIFPNWFVNAFLLAWWSVPASGIIFFLFFGFGEEAMKEYRKVWAWIKRNVLRKKDASEKGFTSSKPTRFSAPKPLHLVDLKNSSSSSPSTVANPLFRSSSTTSSRPSTLTIAPSTPSRKAKSFNKSTTSLTSSMLSSPSTSKTLALNTEEVEKEWKKLSLNLDPNHSNLEIDVSDGCTIRSLSYYSSTCHGDDLSPTSAISPRPTISETIPPLPYTPQSRTDNPFLSRGNSTTSAFSHHRSPSPVLSVPESVGPTSWSKPSELASSPSSPEPTSDSPGRFRIPTEGIFGCYPDPIRGMTPAFHRPFSPPLEYPAAKPCPSNASVLPVPPENGILVTVQRQASVDELV